MEEVFFNFTKINTPPGMFFTFFKLYKWYQIAQRISYYQYISELSTTSIRFTDT